MTLQPEIKRYPAAEELINIASHGFGLLLSLIALGLLLMYAHSHGGALHFLSLGVFGISLVILYATSTLYHSARDPLLRARLRIFDHVSIYILIAGTYTPFTLLVLEGALGWALFAVSWAMALCGSILKLFFTGRYRITSTVMYVLMGWLIVFAIKPLSERLATPGLFWLVGGGLAYSLGAVLYSIKRIPFNHALFHVFVLLGSACHFISLYFYVLLG